MTDKTVLDEVRGTITKVYEYPVSNGKTITSMEKGIIIQPDDETKGGISEAFIGRDYSQFSVGQRVVHVSYTWKRPATEYEKIELECPDEVDEFDYVTYDELSYDEKIQSSKKR